jgi:ABC-type nitrate/sulfonate/bicarbonate transport system substrate-binding protein
MKRSESLIIRAVLLGMFACAGGQHAQSQTPVSVKIGGLRTIQFMPVQYALKEGYFKREGLDVDLVLLNSGPAVISAVLSGSVQVGYASPVPIIFARAQGQPVRMFNALTMTSSQSAMQWNSLIASERSGVKSVKELAGKTLALNTMGGACELQFREAMGTAGVSFDGAKKIVVPFPQMQAALQLGNADAACPVEPFRASMLLTPEVKGTVLASGTVSGATHRYPEDILFTSDEWGNANKDLLLRINHALASAIIDLKKDPALLRRMLVEDLKLSDSIVEALSPGMEFTSVVPDAADIEPIVGALNRHQMLKSEVRPGDTVLTLQ